jgi:hypothetical protein
LFREHWRDPAFWRWWWVNHAPAWAKLSLAGVAVIAFLAVGFLAADRLSSANARSLGTANVTYETTLERVVTVRERGRVVVRRVPVVRRVVYRPQTALVTLFGTHVVTTRGAVRYVPTVQVQKRVVTVGGQTRTITDTRLVPTTRTRTQTQTQTRTQTQTQTQTETQTHTETNVVTQQQTVVRTETVPVTVQQTVTEVSPPGTVTVAVTVPITITVPTLP